MKSETFQDQADADKAACDFMTAMSPDIPYEIETFVLRNFNNGYEIDGRVMCLWYRGRLMAQAIVVRDPMNCSTLTCVDLRENLESRE